MKASEMVLGKIYLGFENGCSNREYMKLTDGYYARFELTIKKSFYRTWYWAGEEDFEFTLIKEIEL